MRDGYVPFSDAGVNIASSPVLYGLAVYTVFSVNKSADGVLNAFRLRDHWDRLNNSTAMMGMSGFPGTWTFESFTSMVDDLIKKNSIAEDVLVRVSVFVDALIAGTKITGLPLALSAYVYPIGEILPRTGINVCISTWRHNPSNAIPARAKVNGGYVNVCLMKNEAIKNGYDDAIALDQKGFVTEATVANLFLVKNSALITPSLDFDILEGITRRSVIQIAKDLGLVVEERPVLSDELFAADEAFICGSSARITPILSIDKRPVGTGKIGDLTAKLMRIYEDIQREKSEIYKGWLTKIDA